MISALALFFSLSLAYAETPQGPELLPPDGLYERNPDCSEIAPPGIFFQNGLPGSSSAPEAPLLPPEGLRAPLAQGEADLCFSYASAELISQRTGVIVAPLDIATTYYFTPIKDFARALEEQGVPSANVAAMERKIRADRQDVSIMNPKGAPAVGFIDYIAGGDEDSALLMANAKGLCPSENLDSDQGFDHQREELERLRAEVSGLRGHVPADSPFSHDRLASGVNAAWFNYVDQRCQRKPSPVPILPVQVAFAKDLASWRGLPQSRKRAAHEPLFSRIDYALDNGRVAIAGIDWYIFEDPDGTDGDHAITVVGRKKVGGVCHYLLRDNVNEPCENLHDKFVPRCRNGHIWVTESELAETLYSVTYLR